MAEVSQLVGHEGPVWQVTWAHPKFGSLLASCGFDHKVIVWKELQESQWVQVWQCFSLMRLCWRNFLPPRAHHERYSNALISNVMHVCF